MKPATEERPHLSGFCSPAFGARLKPSRDCKACTDVGCRCDCETCPWEES